jgi:hypothetical protein
VGGDVGKLADAPGSGWAKVALPSIFKLGLESLADRCGWQLKNVQGSYCVRTDESYHRVSEPALLSLHDLIDPAPSRREHPGGFAVLDTVPDQAGLLGESIDPLIDHELARHQQDGGLGAAVATFSLTYTVCSSSVVADQVRELRRELVPAVDDESSLHVVRLAARLNWRAAAVRTLLAGDITPGAFESADGQFAGFRSAQGLLAGMTYGAVPYLAPALLPAAPYVNGVMATRVGANLIWLFEHPLAGRMRPTDELLEALADTLGRFHPRDGVPKAVYKRPTYGRQGSLTFLAWWIRRLNVLFGIATDVGRFVDSAGQYEPRRHFAFLLSLERLFASVHQTLTETGRNETMRLSTAYDALDCLDGMGVSDFGSMTTPSSARATLERLRSELPSDVAEVALPRCEAAVRALEGVKDGFFLPGVATVEGLKGVPGLGASVLGWDKATRDYLRIDRNSAHSFVNELDPVTQPRKFAIFSAHDGRLSPHLADLAFLWLLAVLSRPSLLSRPIDHKGRKKG